MLGRSRAIGLCDVTPLDAALGCLQELAQAWATPIPPAQIPLAAAAFDDARVRAFFNAADTLPVSDVARVMAEVSRVIDRLPTFQGARLALMAGTQIEKGAPAEPTHAAILRAVVRAAPDALRYCERAEAQGLEVNSATLSADVHGEGYRALLALRFLAMAAMAGLARDGTLRRGARRERAVIEAVRDLERGSDLGELYALSELLDSSDDDEIVVISPATERAARFRTVAVRNCAHLYTLLDLAMRERGVDLLGDVGVTPADLSAHDRNILAAARGDVEAYRLVHDASVRTRLLFATLDDLRPDGTFVAFPIPGVDARLTAFGRVGRTIVLLAADRASTGPDRTWSVNFFDPLHASLRPDLVLGSPPSRTEVAGWLQHRH